MPLLERVKFAGIMGMIYDEFFMKRIGGLRRQVEKKKRHSRAPDGLTPTEELAACRTELRAQARIVAAPARATSCAPRWRRRASRSSTPAISTRPSGLTCARYFARVDRAAS